jgi:hypothetical protein
MRVISTSGFSMGRLSFSVCSTAVDVVFLGAFYFLGWAWFLSADIAAFFQFFTRGRG